MQKKMGFFTRIKKSIFKFEEYEKFTEEPLKKAFGYFFKLMLVFSLLITIALGFKLNKGIQKYKTAITTEFPKFELKNNVLEIEGQDKFEYYLEDYNLQFIMDKTGENYTENDYDNCLIMLKDKAVVKYRGVTQEISYNNLGEISNQIMVDFFKTNEWKLMYFNICLAMLILNFILYGVIILLDIFTLSILGLILNILIRTKFSYKDLVKISIYAMTLPIILYLIYIVSNCLFGTTIKFFQFAYSTISYIYLITVMLMMKTDIIKNTQELQKVLEEQKKVKEELKRQAEEEKEKEKQRKKEKEKEKQEQEEGKNSKEEPQADNG